jgi:hypothetical protein
MALIDEWMGLNHRATLDWSTVMKLEGGYGASKISSVEQARLPENEGTWPGIWFQSGQTDYTVYGRYDYVYSLLFGRQISAGSMKIIAEHIPTLGLTEGFAKPMLWDWGGSIFTSHDLHCYLHDQIDSVVMVNLLSPQLEFAKWFIRRLMETAPEEDDFGYVGISTIVEERALPFLRERLGPHGTDESGSRSIVIMSEVLEHIQNPEELILNIAKAGIDHFYFASSFCTPAYGHHIPIRIGRRDCETPRVANKTWRTWMEGFGIELTKLYGWNSRVYYGHVTEESHVQRLRNETIPAA